MASDQLTTLLRLRRIQVDGRRRELMQQDQYRFALLARIDETEESLRTALPPLDGYRGLEAHVDTYQGHIKRLRSQQQALLHHLSQVDAKVTAVLEQLGAERLAAHAVEELLNERAQRRKAHVERREQHDLDDVSRGILLRKRLKG